MNTTVERKALALPGGHDKVLLHSCCAPCSGEVMEAMLEIHPYYSVGEIPAGAYRGLDETIETIAVMNWIFAMEPLDGGVVETVLNVMENDRVSLEEVHEMARQGVRGLPSPSTAQPV